MVNCYFRYWEVGYFDCCYYQYLIYPLNFLDRSQPFQDTVDYLAVVAVDYLAANLTKTIFVLWHYFSKIPTTKLNLSLYDKGDNSNVYLTTVQDNLYGKNDDI